MSPAPQPIAVVLGPTASGKTRFAVALARALGGEVVSADSRQVYRGLDVGSGKDLGEYGEGPDRVPYHLIDIVDLEHEFSVFEFQQRCFACFDELRERGVTPVLAGGTGLYLDAALAPERMVAVPESAELRAELAELDRDALVTRLKTLKGAIHNSTDTIDRERLIRAIEIAAYPGAQPPGAAPPLAPVVVGMQWDRPALHRRIEARLRERLDGGMVEEVERLRARGVTVERLRMLGLEYRYVTDYLEGHIRNRNDLLQKLGPAIKNFAKRQETWFRRMERRGTPIRWIPEGRVDEIGEVVTALRTTPIAAGRERAGE